MNTPNNKRRKTSIEKIKKAFIKLLQNNDISKITVSDICQLTGLNRSTFYANFQDIYDLADKTRMSLEREFSIAFSDYRNQDWNTGAVKMFTHIKENQIFYKTYFKLCYGNTKISDIYKDKMPSDKTDFYATEFFRNGLNAIIKLWLDDGCIEEPEEMAKILKREYKEKYQTFNFADISTTKNSSDELKCGKYRHFKGNEYEVLGVALDSETCSETVIYKALYGDNKIWVRPKSMFSEYVLLDGKKVKRFEYIGT